MFHTLHHIPTLTFDCPQANRYGTTHRSNNTSKPLNRRNSLSPKSYLFHRLTQSRLTVRQAIGAISKTRDLSIQN
ncbi:hypothetical protein HanPSC8_Chr12g0509931 [Helianthus annuus]|nr:hypothetical protein HanIR_Chr12g0570561 [Helianthus annuus]KAJ0861725.1 hypothetical protein HanPSC8_Chr12g0509931 [Helianthus annuus]